MLTTFFLTAIAAITGKSQDEYPLVLGSCSTLWCAEGVFVDDICWPPVITVVEVFASSPNEEWGIAEGSDDESKGAFLVADNRVFNGPLGRSLRSFARTAHSAHSLRSAPLRYARFARSLRSRARSLTSLTPSWDSGNS